MANIDDILGVVPIKESFYVQIGRKGIVYLTADGIKLPNGLYIRYNKLRVDNYQYIYSPGRGGKDTKKIWGGVVVENITQALAKIVIGHQMIKVAKKYRVGLTVHDSIVCLVPETEIQEALEYVKMCLSTPPDWAKTLPVACKVTYGRTYGDC
jgi:hypothetical protein